ncbi:ybeY [Wigglesworthia glossinidia endosymbiont of Glossina brevipalpis]|uniref:Endoribonuclease YbeY n=1 Tax=Wigglesworthia glossinidia brevipalpis TaxID=36870 RepID=YBEY_WIGBR|nr:RecName: Full=Endoribonuclease YbeY [Wigglesworthia glossinidia endosymbiont of Glossina brevipalpis]BAC24593.1 ybeY [Wigglesworthia glossinidia endosymbiont of Glossina brevipalpis]
MNDNFLNIQIECCLYKQTPSIDKFKFWIKSIFLHFKKVSEINLRLVEKKEIKNLNKKFLKKNYPTNILAFPCIMPNNDQISFLGDLVVCSEIVEKEAKNQNKSVESHWAHIIIHGTLHLLGYDHSNNSNKIEEMEILEIKFLNLFGYHNPYF